MLAASFGAAQIRYQLIELTSLPGFPGGSAIAINDVGQIALTSSIYNLNTGAVVPVPGIVVGETPSLSAINNQGFATGEAEYQATTSLNDNRAFRFDPNTNSTSNLGGLTNNRSQGLSINESGSVVGVGRLTSATSSQRAARFNGDGTVTNLASIGFTTDASIATDINDNGVIVGSGRLTGDAASHPLIFDGVGGATRFGLLAGHSRGRASAINNGGVAVGWTAILTVDTQRPTMWNIANPGTVVELSRPTGGDYGGTTAIDINESGTIIGTSILNGTDAKATVWQNGVAYDLNTILTNPNPDFVLSNIRDINNLGEIVGFGMVNGEIRGFLLKPVPEPSTLAALGLGALALLRRRRRA